MKLCFSSKKAAALLAVLMVCGIIFLANGIRKKGNITSLADYSANWGFSLHQDAQELFYTETDHTFGGGIRCSVLRCSATSPYGLSSTAPRKDPQNIITVTHGDHAAEEILTRFASAAGEVNIPEELLPPEDGWRWTMAEKGEDQLVILSDETTVWIAEILQQKGAW